MSMMRITRQGMFLTIIFLQLASFSSDGLAESAPGIIKIGWIGPITGPMASLGSYSLRGAKLAVEEVNFAGGIKGKKVELLASDTKADPQKGIESVNRLINVEKVTAIIGDLLPSVTTLTVPISSSSNIIQISYGPSHDYISAPFFFSMTSTNKVMDRAILEYISKGKKMRRISILYSSDFLRDITRIEEISKNLSIELLEKIEFKKGETDFTSHLLRIKNKLPEAIMFLGSFPEIALAVSGGERLSLDIPIYSTQIFIDRGEFLALSKKRKTELVIFGDYFPKVSGTAIESKFIEGFKSKFGIYPNSIAALTFDATRVLLNAIKEKGEKSEDIRRALVERVHGGVVGAFGFKSSGNITKKIFILVFSMGNLMELAIDPPPITNG